MPRVIHFEVVALEPERAAKFYSEVFGWTTHLWDGPMPYWLVTTGADEEPGINGGIVKTQDTSAPALTVNTIDVPDVDAYVEKVTAAGGINVVPKMAVPGVGYLAYCKDTEGIVFGLMQMDETAGQ
jgi:predicted enzyme related to lactoylglutathione lyase